MFVASHGSFSRLRVIWPPDEWRAVMTLPKINAADRADSDNPLISVNVHALAANRPTSIEAS
ncbi:hypothetical protein NWI01_29840 [Nitrobacter winogradskyi]|uniref:Uncharacterized protein n=1 Tax=Nitrobacter winogradskyi TaxID=913 RepID=A0A4Y3WDI6_NITWI|nr:hypothetical protein NWI01_29840 [Nitrobacter winogradskyi]